MYAVYLHNCKALGKVKALYSYTKSMQMIYLYKGLYLLLHAHAVMITDSDHLCFMYILHYHI